MQLKIVTESFRSFFEDDCLNLSAAVAFYSIISVIPLLFLIFFVSGLVLGSSEGAYMAVVDFIKELHPYMEEKLLLEVKRLSDNTTFMGWAGLGFLIWISTMFVSSLETAFTTIFRVKSKRNPLLSLLMAVAIIPLGFCAILFTIGLNSWAVYIERWQLGHLLLNSTLIRYILPLSVIMLFFTLIYKFIPNRRVCFLHALTGGIVCTLFLEAAKYFFAFYLSLEGNPVGFVYGSLKALIYIVIWVFYMAVITLYAGEIVSILTRRRELS
ncbi:MAG: YihY/virulence factor BrkB family protein [Deltaproteobacteria bacterium]|nr:YihY/virulence factor BrkB family protein [Deltaproteobacteria bacterium]